MNNKMMAILLFVLAGKCLFASDVAIDVSIQAIEEEDQGFLIEMPEAWRDVYSQIDVASLSYGDQFWPAIARLRITLGEEEPTKYNQALAALAAYFSSDLCQLIMDYRDIQGPWSKAVLAELPEAGNQNLPGHSVFGNPELFHYRICNAALLWVVQEANAHKKMHRFGPLIKRVVDDISFYFKNDSLYVAHLQTIPKLYQERRYEEMDKASLEAMVARLPHIVNDMINVRIKRHHRAQLYVSTEALEIAQEKVPRIAAKEPALRKKILRKNMINKIIHYSPYLFVIGLIIITNILTAESCKHGVLADPVNCTKTAHNDCTGWCVSAFIVCDLVGIPAALIFGWIISGDCLDPASRPVRYPTSWLSP